MRQPIRETAVTLTNILTIRKDGNVYRYLRIKGRPLVKLPDLPPDHPAFLAAYAAAKGAAVTKRGHRQPGSIAALCEAAMKSEAYLGFSAGYRANLRRHIDAIRDQAAEARSADLRPEHIGADLSVLPASVAQLRHKAWRFICQFGKATGLLAADPTIAVPRPSAPSGEGHPAWTRDDVDAYRARWHVGTVQRAIFELLHWTGARIGDAVLIGPGMIDRTGVLCFRQTKTGGMAYVPWTCALPDYAATMQDDRALMHAAIARLSGQMTFLPARGAARSAKAIGGDISKSARLAGVRKSGHGLRKTRAYSLADAGATTHQIAAWTGHESLSEIAHYTKQADRRRAVMGTEREGNVANSQIQVQTKVASD